MRRPIGITILAVSNYLSSAWTSLLVVCWSLAPVSTTRILDTIDRATTTSSWTAPTLLGRLLALAVGAAISTFLYFLGQALWQLKNWARLLTVVFCIADVFSGGRPEIGEPFWWLLQPNLAIDLIGRILAVATICYLQMDHVRVAFGKPPLDTPSKVAWTAAAVLLVSYPLLGSGPEIRAAKWHFQNGDRYVVNRVSLPVYYWHAPDRLSSKCELKIEDEPGPLRKRDRFMAITVNACKPPETTQSVEASVEGEIQSFERSGYTGMQKVTLSAGGQTLQCVKENFHILTYYCYGNGPIYFASFAGSGAQEPRFRNMLALARLEQK